MRTYHVCIVNLQPGKTAIIAEDNDVLGVIDGEEMTNAEFFRSFAKFIREHSGGEDVRVLTNMQLVQRKNHTSNFPNLIFHYKQYSYPRRQHFLAAAYEWTDKKDKQEDLL